MPKAINKLALKKKLYAERERLMHELMHPNVPLELRKAHNQSLQAINDMIDICVARNRF